jgi:MinD-like ATPase involved in chromosome partitioning or flagellar assembly
MQRCTYLILLEEPHAWVAAATLARQSEPGTVETLIAPVPGVAFLSARDAEGAELDEWWHRMATAPGRPVVVAAHEDDLPRWIPGLDADFLVAVPDEQTLNLYRQLPNVFATVDDDPRQIAELALRRPFAPTGAPQAPPPPRAPEPMLRQEPPAWYRPPAEASAAAPPPPPPAPPPPAPPPPAPPRPAPPPFERPVASARASGRMPERPPSGLPPGIVDPFELLSHADLIEPPEPADGFHNPPQGYGRQAPMSRRSVLVDATRPTPRLNRGGSGPRQILDRLGQGRRAPVNAELGQALLACKPLVAAVVSRKGGVGKTASAAAVAAILGEAVDPFGHTAALIDANVGNPDAWGRLDVRGHPATMRDIVRSLMTGREPPGPAYAETPALAVYPEARDAGDGYAPAQIQRVATYLKGRHAALIVDLPNRLPAFTSAEAAVAAAWIGEADVLVLPTTADPTALLGAIEYLDADSVQGKPVVVSYIVPRIREIRDAPQVRGLLDRIRASVAAVVEVPDDDRATLALVRHVAITEVGTELRQAYLDLASRVVEAAANRHGGWG